MVVISPHIDDAVFSLAATIAGATHQGTTIDILTVFGLDPASDGPANGWDTRGGFLTEGGAATGRRIEDATACGIVGAEPHWLRFRGGGYTSERPTAEIHAAVLQAVNGADAVLIPGFPLTNPDHAWLSALLIERSLPCRRLGLYAEQPYRYGVRKDRPRPEIPATLEDAPSRVGDWTHRRPRIREYRLKRRAILAYASQLPLLGYAGTRKLDRLLLHEARQGGEAISWLETGRTAGTSTPA